MNRFLAAALANAGFEVTVLDSRTGGIINGAVLAVTGNASVVTLGREKQCIQEWNSCLERDKKASAACGPNAQGDYSDCQRASAKNWVDCAMAELACEEKIARQKCGEN